MTTAMNVLRRLSARQPATGLPREFYVDERVFELDLELIFYRQWLFAAHESELPQPGSYLTLQVGAYPIVLVRGGSGLIRAFVNSCRHRGSRLCRAERGRAARLVCPYHQWTYDLDGRLFAARQMGAGFDRGAYALKQLHCETVAGYIFVCLAAQAPDFSATRAQLSAYLGPHRLAAARVAFESTIIEDGNWKLVWENNRECYHCAGNHPELARTFPDSPTTTGVSGAASDPVIVEHWRHCEALGLPSEFRLSPDGGLRTARMPLLGSAVSYTASGEAAVARALCADVAPGASIGALLAFHYPTTWNHVLADHAISFRVLPLSATRTQLTTKWLVHPEAQEGRDYSLEELTGVWRATNEQDRRIVQENQIGVSSPSYEPGPFADPQETGVRQFVEWYSAHLQAHLAHGAGTLTEVA